MCSVGGELKRTIKRFPTESDLCRKCKCVKAEVSLKVDDFYCKGCFEEYLVHKFRSTIGKSKLMKHEDKILVAFSGGLSSTCLLNLLSNDENEMSSSGENSAKGSKKKMFLMPSVLYVYDSRVHNPQMLLQIQKVTQSLSFPAYYTFTEEVLRESEHAVIKDLKVPALLDEISNYQRQNAELIDKWKQFLSDCDSPTSQRDALNVLIETLICRCAKNLNLSKVFFATNGSTLAVEMLSGVAIGRGAHSADRLNFHTRLCGVEIYRPMRELYEDELRQYANLNDLCVSDYNEPSYGEENEGKDIFSCTKSFISGLEENFISTVPTVVRTGNKLQAHNVSAETEQPENLCSYCCRIIDVPDTDDSSAVRAIEFSRQWIKPEDSPTKRDQPLLRVGMKSASVESPVVSPVIDDLSKYNHYSKLCFGCSNLFNKKIILSHS